MTFVMSLTCSGDGPSPLCSGKSSHTFWEHLCLCPQKVRHMPHVTPEGPGSSCGSVRCRNGIPAWYLHCCTRDPSEQCCPPEGGRDTHLLGEYSVWVGCEQRRARLLGVTGGLLDSLFELSPVTETQNYSLRSVDGSRMPSPRDKEWGLCKIKRGLQEQGSHHAGEASDDIY